MMTSISKINPLNFAKNLVIMMVFINILNFTFKLLTLNIWPPCPTMTSVVISVVTTGNFNICMGPPPKLITFFY